MLVCSDSGTVSGIYIVSIVLSRVYILWVVTLYFKYKSVRLDVLCKSIKIFCDRRKGQ